VKTNDILSGQFGLEGIRWALRGQPVRRKLRNAIGSLLPNPARLGAFYLRRSKYKPGSRLTAYYDIHLSAPDRQKTNHRLIEVDWRPMDRNDRPLKLPDAVEKQSAVMQEVAQRSGLAAPFLRLAAELPTLGIRIQVYPLDPHFPQLVSLSNPHYVRDRLESEGLIDLDGRKNQSESKVVITPIRYRPGERHVLRVDVTGVNGSGEEATTFFAKLYDVSGDGARRMKVANQVADWLDTSGIGVDSARPSAYLIEDEALLYPEVTGAPLSQSLHRPGRKVAHNLSLAGAALRTLHEAPDSLLEVLPPKTLDSEIKVIQRAAQHIHILLPQAGAKIERILGLIQEIHQRLPGEPPTFTHSDFKADHLRVSGKGLTLIDFDTCSLADPASDIGKFLADLRFWYEFYGQPGVELAQEQFLSGYGLRDADIRVLRASLYEALVLIKITIRRVPLFDRNWAERTQGLIDRSGQLLGTLTARIGSLP